MEKKFYLKPDTEVLFLTESNFLCISGGDLADQKEEYGSNPDNIGASSEDIFGPPPGDD